jgi:signal transduction histidine kinase
VLIRIKDNGIGMRKADIAQALFPFVQLDQPSPRGDTGTGLGLSLSKTLIEAHGGALALDSELGFGTIAMIRLPKARTVPAMEKPEASLQQAA